MGSTATSGGDVDLAALLLGTESGDAATPAFPATLQAALAEGADGVAGEAIVAEAIAAEGSAASAATGDPEGTGANEDGDASTDDDTAMSLDAALAAALGLIADATPPVPEAVTAAASEEGDAVAAASATDVGASGGPVVGGIVASAPAAAAESASGGGSEPAVTPQALQDGGETSAHLAAASEGTQSAESSAPAVASAAGSDGAATTRDAVRPVPDARLDAHADDPTVTRTAAAPSDIPTRRTASSSGPVGPSEQTTRPGQSDVASNSSVAPASRDDGGQQALDLGTSDRTKAFIAAASRGAATATAPGRAGEQLHTTGPLAPAAASEAPPALPPATTPSHAEGSAAGVERSAAHPTGIEARWGDRVVDALRFSAARGGGEIRLQLEPEGLGHIDVRVHLQPDGVRAIIVAEHESTRALLVSQQHVLEQALGRSDVRLAGFSVDVGSGGGAASSFTAEDQPGGDAASPPPAVAGATPPAEVAPAAAEPLAGGHLSLRV